MRFRRAPRRGPPAAFPWLTASIAVVLVLALRASSETSGARGGEAGVRAPGPQRAPAALRSPAPAASTGDTAGAPTVPSQADPARSADGDSDATSPEAQPGEGVAE